MVSGFLGIPEKNHGVFLELFFWKLRGFFD